MLNYCMMQSLVNGISDSFLTVLTLDLDVPYASLGTTEKPLLHYMAYNYQVRIGLHYPGQYTSYTCICSLSVKKRVLHNLNISFKMPVNFNW